MTATARVLVSIIIFLAFGVRVAEACEPIVPLARLFGGPLVLTASLTLLAVGIAFKCLLFGWFARASLRWPRAVWTMLAANLFSTVVGLLAALPFTVPVFIPIGIGITYVVSLLPAHRYAPWLSAQMRRSVGPYRIAGIVTGVFAASVGLWLLAQASLDRADYGWYWILKLGYVFAVLVVSIGLTIFFEDWTVSRLNHAATGTIPYFPAVARANLYTLLLLMAVAVIKIFPQRLQHPHFLLSRVWVWLS